MDTARQEVKITLPMSARSTRPARRWLAAVLAPLLFAGVAGRVEAAARCLGAALQPHCCCHAEAEAPAPVRIERKCCCEVDQPTTPAAPIQTAEAGGAAFASSLVATATTGPRAPRLVVGLVPPVRAPAIGPPLILLKRSLLI